MASTLNAKQMRILLQSISTDPQLKQSKDSILPGVSGRYIHASNHSHHFTKYVGFVEVESKIRGN